MGIFDGLLNMFKNSNTATPTAPAASPKTGNNAGHPAYRMAPQYQSVRPPAQSPAKTAASPNAGAANWFNGIGTASTAKKSDNLTVYSLKGTPLHLTTSDCKASGGEGTVYAIPGKPNVLVKIYKDDLLQNPAKRSEIEKRIYDMLAISKDIDQASFAWPRAVVCNSRRQVIGFAMNKCSGISFQAFSGVKSIQQRFPKWTRRELALVAQDFLTKLQYLASKKILVNDFNPANFLVDQKGHVSFIDCDSYQIPGERNSTDITKTYFASHVAPELLENPKLLAQPRNIHHVEFGAALTVFNILMCGLHPYSYFDPSRQSACGTPDENLRKGRCPLGTGAHCMLPRGNWYNLWSYLNYKLKSSFIQTFRDGHKDPSKRATLADLQANLQELLFIMKKDPVRLDLNPVKPKPSTKSSSANQSFSMDF
jgi:DNA-binding helix-hairpin-helix protein with protein kinase domain